MYFYYSYLFTFSEGLPFGNGLKRRIYFNDRLACAKGISPKNDLDGGCSMFRNYCCNKTYLEVAKWDFEIRGKCIVLRSLKATVCSNFKYRVSNNMDEINLKEKRLIFQIFSQIMKKWKKKILIGKIPSSKNQAKVAL